MMPNVCSIGRPASLEQMGRMTRQQRSYSWMWNLRARWAHPSVLTACIVLSFFHIFFLCKAWLDELCVQAAQGEGLEVQQRGCIRCAVLECRPPCPSSPGTFIHTPPRMPSCPCSRARAQP